MPRRRLIAVATLLLAAGVGVWLAFARPASAINRTNALKIKPGMTLAEVEAILGGPARDEDGIRRSLTPLWDPRYYRDEQGRSCASGRRDIQDLQGAVKRQPPATRASWRTRRCDIEIWLDDEGSVYYAFFCRLRRNYNEYPESWLIRARYAIDSWLDWD